MKKIVAIGGGENGRFLEDGTQTLYETEAIDKEIIRLLIKKILIFCFLHMQCVFQKKYMIAIMKL